MLYISTEWELPPNRMNAGCSAPASARVSFEPGRQKSIGSRPLSNAWPSIVTERKRASTAAIGFSVASS